MVTVGYCPVSIGILAYNYGKTICLLENSTLFEGLHPRSLLSNSPIMIISFKFIQRVSFAANCGRALSRPLLKATLATSRLPFLLPQDIPKHNQLPTIFKPEYHKILHHSLLLVQPNIQISAWQTNVYKPCKLSLPHNYL